MPQSKFFTSKFEGLVTEVNPFTAPMWSFADVSNAIFSRENFIYSRHGHGQFRHNSLKSTTYDIDLTKAMTLGLSVDNLGRTRYQTFFTDDTTNAIYQDTTVVQSGPTVNTYNGAVTAADNNTRIVTPKPRFFHNGDRVYLMTNLGLHYSETAFTAPAWQQWTSPAISLFDAQITTTVDKPVVDYGYRTLVCATLIMETDDGRIIESAPCAPVTVDNTSFTKAFPRVTVRCGTDTASGAVGWEKVRVYRTKTFRIGSDAPTDFRLVSENTLTQPSSTNTTTIDLFLNDGAFIFEKLYTSIEGTTSRNQAPPVARDVCTFKNYTFYGDVLKNALAKVTLRTIPTYGSSITLTLTNSVSGVAALVTGVAVSGGEIEDNPAYEGARATNSEGVTTGAVILSSRSATAPYNSVNTSKWVGISHTNADITAVQGRRITIVQGTGAGQVTPYAMTNADMTMSSFSGVIRDIYVTPATIFDASRFPPNGILAVVSNGDSNIHGFYTYATCEADIANNRYIFSDCMRYGATFPSSGPLHTGQSYLFYVPGSAPHLVSIYAGDNATYYSLIPTNSNYPDELGIPYAGQSWHYNGNELRTSILYKGPAKQSFSQLLNVNARKTAAALATALSTHVDVYPAGDGAMYIRLKTRVYDRISVSASAAGLFEPGIVTSATLLAESEECPNGLVYSRNSTPEMVPEFTLLAPELVGKPDKRILRMAATQDSVFVFKEEEGIYRFSVEGSASSLPQITSIALLDNTTWLVASESIQVIDDAVYFLSNKGFCRLKSSGITLVGDVIHTEILAATTKVTLDDVRSFGNSAKKLYGCYFPGLNADGTGVTYVLDTWVQRWSKWDLEFQDTHTDQYGQMTSLVVDYPLTGAPTTTADINAAVVNKTAYNWSYLRQDRFTSDDPYNVTDQYDDRLFLQTGSVFEPSEMPWLLTSKTYNAVTKQLTLIAAAANTYPLQNLRHFANRCKGKQLFLRSTINGVANTCVAVTIVSVTTEEALPTVPTQLVVQLPLTVTSLSLADTDQLVTGVNLELTTNMFTGGNPTTLKQFGEMQVQTNGSATRMGVSFKVDTQSSFTTETVFDTTITNQTTFRTYYPLLTTRGRFTIIKLTHNKPYEQVNITGMSVVYRDTQSPRVQKDQA